MTAKRPTNVRQTFRRYSVEEIDQMRESVKAIYRMQQHQKGNDLDKDWLEIVEDRLRTHMLNGTTPADLRKQAEKEELAEDEHWKRAREHQAALEAEEYARLRARAEDIMLRRLFGVNDPPRQNPYCFRHGRWRLGRSLWR